MARITERKQGDDRWAVYELLDRVVCPDCGKRPFPRRPAKSPKTDPAAYCQCLAVVGAKEAPR